MVPLSALWLPILLSAVLVFVVSSVIHMVLTYHRNDFRRLPDEDAVQDCLGKTGVAPGDYVLPFAGSPAGMKDPAFVAKMTRGPVAFVTVAPSGPPNMNVALLLWFLYSIVIGVLAGYLAGRLIGPGADYLTVFRAVGTTAFMGYALALPQNSIWYKRNWPATLKTMFDGLVYALLTAGAFGWLWPEA